MIVYYKIVCVCVQVVGGNLLPDAATWFLISTLKGLQLHGQHEVCCATLTLLAMLIYENLVRAPPQTLPRSHPMIFFFLIFVYHPGHKPNPYG